VNFQTTQCPPRFDIARDAKALRVPARLLGMTLIGFHHSPRLFNRWLRLQRNRQTLCRARAAQPASIFSRSLGRYAGREFSRRFLYHNGVAPSKPTQRRFNFF
jgi:hypothetical protein